MPRLLRKRSYGGTPRALWEYHIPWAHHQHGDFVRTRILDEEQPTNNRIGLPENEPRNTFRQDVNIALENEYGSEAYNVRDNAKKVLVARYGRPDKMVTFPSRNKYCGHHCLPRDSSIDSYHYADNTNWKYQSQFGCCRCRLAERNFMVPSIPYETLLKVLNIDPSTVEYSKYGIPTNIMGSGNLLESGGMGSDKNGWNNKRGLLPPYNRMRYMHGALGRSLFFSQFTRLTDQFNTDNGKKGLHLQQEASHLNLYAGRMQFLMQYERNLSYNGASQPGGTPNLRQPSYLKQGRSGLPFKYADPDAGIISLIGTLPPFAPATHLGWHAGLRRPVVLQPLRWEKTAPRKIVDLLGVISGSSLTSKMCVHCRHVVKSLPMHLFWEARGYDHKTAVKMAEKDTADLKEAKATYTPEDLKHLAPMLGATEQDQLPARLEAK